MHIVFVTPELATAGNSSGGLASFTANMARIFASNGHKVTVLLATVKDEKLSFDEDIELKTTYINKAIWNIFDKTAKICTFGEKENTVETRRFIVNFYRSGQVRKKIREINKREKIDIIHYCSLSAMAFRANKAIPYVIRLSSFSSICRGANLPDGDIRFDSAGFSMKDRLLNYTLQKAKYVISPSKLLADIGKKELGLEATVIESPFVLTKIQWDESVFHSVIGNERYIIHYGSLKYLKGTHIVAKIVKSILQTYPDLFLILAGRNEELLDEDGIKVKADELVKRSAGELADRVLYAGSLSREQLYPFIQNAELCLLPSRIENLSNACIEAMAMGKIVIGTNGASFEQLIDDRVSGFLCERDNPESYLQAVNEALEMSNEDKEKMILKSAERIKLLRPEIIYKKYLEFYEGVIREW